MSLELNVALDGITPVLGNLLFVLSEYFFFLLDKMIESSHIFFEILENFDLANYLGFLGVEAFG